MTAQPGALEPDYLSYMKFGHVLDVGDVDGDGDAEVFAGSQHISPYVALPGRAELLDGSSLESTVWWEGNLDSERDYGRGVGILTAESGVQLAFLSSFSFWLMSPDDPSGSPAEAGGVYIANGSPDGYYAAQRLTAVDVMGTPDEDVVLECSTGTAIVGLVCVFEGPVLTSGTVSDADLIVSGGLGLGSGLAGADVDGDGRSDLVLGASNAQGDRGEISVLLGPVPAGVADTADAHRSWTGENPGDWLGQVVSTGDLDGDGIDEVVGSAMAWPDNERRGRVYGLPLDAPDAQGATFVIDGDPLQHLGMGLATGDLNGDGQDDLAVGGPSVPVDFSVPGRAFVFFGPVTGSLVTTDADAVYVGEAAGDGAGVAVGIGDVDGDGTGDLVVSAPYNDEAELDAGKIYLLPGPLGP